MVSAGFADIELVELGDELVGVNLQGTMSKWRVNCSNERICLRAEKEPLVLMILVILVIRLVLDKKFAWSLLWYGQARLPII